MNATSHAAAFGAATRALTGNVLVVDAGYHAMG